MPRRLPDPPAFDELEALAKQSASQRTKILTLIGNLTFSWSNNESVFIYLLMILLRTDLKSATIVFVTLNTSRARLDLIHRLGMVTIKDGDAMKRLDNLIKRFNQCTRIRNELNHSIYQVNEQGEITGTTTLRVIEKKGELSVTTLHKLDEKRIREITNVIRRLKTLNRHLWEFLPVLEKHIKSIEKPSGKKTKKKKPGPQK